MPKTRNFSDREKRDAMDLLDIHDDINAVHLLTGINHRTLRRWRKKLRRRQNATLSEKSFSLSEKRTMSEEFLTNQQSNNNPAPAPAPAIQPPANDNAARESSNKTDDDLQRLTYIRGQLMNFVCRLAGDLDPDDPDVNLRTMSLSRTLDRIYWLDEFLDDGEEADESDEDASPNRLIFVDEQGRELPPWRNESEAEPRPNASNLKSPPAEDDEPNRIVFH